MFKSLLVWCMLLAVPLQGFASATTLLCAPLTTASGTMGPLETPAPAHDHQAMLLAAQADQPHTANADMPVHAAGGQCDACSACCFGAAMAASQAVRVPAEAQSFAFILLDLLSAPTVDLALPERPPQTLPT